MRLFTYVSALAAFFFAAGQTGAQAQGGDWTGKVVAEVKEAVTDLTKVTDGYYLLRNYYHKTYVNEKDNGALYLDNIFNGETPVDPSAVKLSSALRGDAKLRFVVYIKKGADGKFTIQVKSGKYIGAPTRGGGMTSTETAEHFTIEKIAGTAADRFSFKPTSNYFTLNGNGYGNGTSGTLVGWNNDAAPTGYPTPEQGNAYSYRLHPVVLGAAQGAFTPQEGKNYAIKALDAESNSYITFSGAVMDMAGSNLTSGDIRRASADASTLPQLWTCEKVTGEDGKYYIKNLNTGLYWGKLETGDQSTLAFAKTTAEAGAYEFPYALSSDDTEYYFIKSDGHYLNAYGGGSDIRLGAYDTNAEYDGGGMWGFQQKTLKVNISADLGWASLCLPVDGVLMSFISQNVTVYKAVSVKGGNTLTLEEVTGGFKAGEGLLLHKEGGGDLLIDINNAGSVPAVTDNVLKGATAARGGFDGGANYFLSDGTDGKPCLLLADDTYTSVPANKAYLPKTAVEGGSTTLSFSFAGQPTGIQAVQTAAEREAVYYDLNGRRVLYPSTGIYVTGGGKKVFLK